MYLHIDTHTCVQVCTYSLFCCLKQPLGRHVFSEHVGIGLEHHRTWDHQQGHSVRLHWIRTRLWCPASTFPKCNSEGKQKVQAKPHELGRGWEEEVQTGGIGGGGRQQWLGVQSSLMNCRREHSEYSFPSADKDISNGSCSLTPNECFTSPVSHRACLSHLPLAVFPAVQHMSLGCCRSEQQYVFLEAPLG